MRRPFTISTFALAVALAPACCLRSRLPSSPRQTPRQHRRAAAGRAAACRAAARRPDARLRPRLRRKLAFTTPAGLLLVQVKPDQTATFEELMGKLKTCSRPPRRRS